MSEAMDAVWMWISGRIPVPSYNVIVVGPREDEPTVFHTFACLEPSGHLTILRSEQVVSDPQVRKAIAACTLPPDADPAYEAFARANQFPTEPTLAWRLASAQGLLLGLPVGLYAIGFKQSDETPRAMLHMNALVRPSTFLRRLKLASAS